MSRPAGRGAQSWSYPRTFDGRRSAAAARADANLTAGETAKLLVSKRLTHE
ncbi:hypothetical protein NKH09_23805 [Mesorhizobium sp. M1339]|uniref:hypothetical protein n=1 Tax=Mesorhizobium sp. M1339 TaxID=2957086 RepID=UPI00333697FE